MNQNTGLFYTAAGLAVLNAITHGTGTVFSGFSSDLFPVLIAGVLWLVIAIGFKSQQRWLTYPAFLLAIIEALIVYSQSGSNTSLTAWVVITISVLCLLTAIVLFVLIWRKAPTKQPA